MIVLIRSSETSKLEFGPSIKNWSIKTQNILKKVIKRLIEGPLIQKEVVISVSAVIHFRFLLATLFLVKDNRLFKQATRSLATFVSSHRSLRSLAPQRCARSVDRLAHSLRSLPHGTVEILQYVLTL